MTVAQKLDKASGVLFFAGFVVSKLQYAPFPLASAIFRFVSLGIYLMAYGFCLTANLLHPDHKEHQDKWYGFAQIKEQFIFSSFIGLLGTVTSIAAVFIPALFPPAAWLFCIGNAIWAVGEYHKFKNPPKNDENYSSSRQRAYLSYSITTTAISLVTAISATLMFVFPPAAIPITIFSLIICAGLGALAFDFWLNSSFGEHKPSPAPNSYHQMSDSLGPSVSNDLKDSPEPECSNCLFWKHKDPRKDNAPEIELATLHSLAESDSEHSLRAYSSL
ncbi:MAG: hypothetical protein ACRCXC_08040 [Legionella sp.]